MQVNKERHTKYVYECLHRCYTINICLLSNLYYKYITIIVILFIKHFIKLIEIDILDIFKK